MKCNWNSTKKTKKKNFLGFIVQDITAWNHKNVRNCYFRGTLGAWEPMWNSMFFYDLVNFWKFLPLSFGLKQFNFKLGFFHLFWIYFRGIIRKNILRSDFHSNRWHWSKKDQKNLPQTSHKFFSQCLIVNFSLLLWAFTVQNFSKN